MPMNPSQCPYPVTQGCNAADTRIRKHLLEQRGLDPNLCGNWGRKDQEGYCTTHWNIILRERRHETA